MKLGDIQGKTLREMEECLEKHKMCLVDRPTGFGKTKVFMEYAKRHSGQRILYVYDMDSAKVDIQQRYNPKNVGFISYGSIARKSKFEEVSRRLRFKHWYFGHYHGDQDVLGKYHLRYKQIERIA